MKSKCAVEVCDRESIARGLCSGHYHCLRLQGSAGTTAIAARVNVGLSCAVAECDSDAKARGWCYKHYQRWLRHGDPEALVVHEPPQHGTQNRYGNHGCRCDACRVAHTDYCREHGVGGYSKDTCECGNQKRVVAEKCLTCFNADREAPHGSEARYKRCLCVACRSAASQARRKRRHASRVPCVGCGSLVDRNPKKDPECRSCSRARIASSRRTLVAA